MKSIWVRPAEPSPGAERIARDPGIPPALARVLAGRGCTDPASALRLLEPRLSEISDPFELPGMEAAVGQVWAAVDAGRPIAVYGDYDVDGVTATALLTGFLRALGADARPFLPHRLDDGYGLQSEPLARCLAQHRPGLVVTVDCGTSSASAVREAQAAGVAVVVTDHHQPGAERAPADALVNPRLGDPSRPWFDLAGVGVAFKLAYAVMKRGLERGDARAAAARDGVAGGLDLVALGTIADCVPLTGENRLLAYHGLRKLRDPSRPGLQALRAVSGVAPGRIRSWDVSFLLAPRLNASGRLESAEAALNLLMARDAAEARNLADRLDAANRERQGIQKETVQQAVDWIQLYTDPELDTALVVADERWHAGVVGIVAARLVGRFHRPAFVIALDGAGGGRGSGRSIEGIPLVECLNECADHLRKYGGHAMAAGIEIDAGRVPAFRDAFRAAVGRRLTPELRNPRLRIDAEVALEEIDLDLADALGRLEPFGQGHPEPVWIARRVNIEEPRILKDAHLKMRLRQGTAVCPAIGFGLAKLPIPDGDADVVFTIERDEWQNRPRVQIKVIDLAPSESRAQA